MCIDGNSASLSVRYLNAQLQALWQNAEECVRHSNWEKLKSPEYEKSKYTRALREFHLLPKRSSQSPSLDELFFFATFHEPKLEFVCNHEAILHLKIESGRLNVAYKDALKPNARGDRGKIHKLDNLELVFRIPFLRTNVKGRDEKVGNRDSKHLIQMIALQVKEARTIMVNADETLSLDVKDALDFYMKQYLLFLQQSGNHVFFDLPDFDDNKFRPHIDYSLIHDKDIDYYIQLTKEEIRLLGSIQPTLVSEFYKMQWMIHSSLRNDEKTWGSVDISLASICTDWIVGSQLGANLFVNFDMPIIEPLCPHEVIVKFRIKELGFFKNAGINENVKPEREYFDFTVAFVVRVKNAEGSGLLQLDFGNAQFARFHSFFGGHEKYAEWKHDIDILIDFFSGEYLDILSRSSLHIIIGIPGVIEQAAEYSEDWSSTSELEEVEIGRKRGRGMLWSERTLHTSVQAGFDQVIGLSEQSINELLERRRFFASPYGRGGLFDMEVTKLSIRLLSNGKAIVFVGAEGSIQVKKKVRSTQWWTAFKWLLPTKDDLTEKFSFGTVTLAYEVDLKLQRHEELRLAGYVWSYVLEEFHNRVSARFQQTYLFDHIDITHLLLDFTNPRYVKELSDVSALSDDEGGDDALERLATVKAYIPDYLHQLAHFGHHIIHTVPMARATSRGAKSEQAVENQTLELFALNDVVFKVFTQGAVSVGSLTHEHVNTKDIPYIMLFGVCGDRPMPVTFGQWTAGWISVGRQSVGTIGLSREIFLERCILNQLKVVNQLTTIVPQSADVVDGHWHVDLTVWAKHPTRSLSQMGCPWERRDDGSLDHLKYVWEYTDHWKHQHHGSDKANGAYSLSCETQNVLYVPTKYNARGLLIEMKGTSKLEAAGKTDFQDWKKSTTATWSATVKVEAKEGGLKISLDSKDVDVESSGDQNQELCPFDIVSMHRTKLPYKVGEVQTLLVNILARMMEGSWEYSAMGLQSVILRDPVFTRNGDLICELDLAKFTGEPVLAFNRDEWIKQCQGEHVEPAIEAPPAHFDYLQNTAANRAGELAYSNGNGNGNGYSNGNGLAAPKDAVQRSFATLAANPVKAVPVAAAGANDGEQESDLESDTEEVSVHE